MRVLLGIAMLICAIHVIVDLNLACNGEDTDLLLHTFYEIVFIASYCTVCGL